MEDEDLTEEKRQEISTITKIEPKFKPGDKVIVTHQTSEEEDIPGTSWPSKKIHSIGKVGTIIRQRINDSEEDSNLEIGTRECYLVLMDDPNLMAIFGSHGWTFQAQGLKKASKWNIKQVEKKKTA